jgi:hypothetical protein
MGIRSIKIESTSFYNPDYPNAKGKYSKSLCAATKPESAALKIIPLSCEGCRIAPCIIIHNSTKRHKLCPCKNCILKSMCQTQCDQFKKNVLGLFDIYLSSDYRRGTFPY